MHGILGIWEARHGDYRPGGNSRGRLVPALRALDAASRSSLGRVGGRVWTRSGPVTGAHNRRAVADKASDCWIATALRQAAAVRAKQGLAAARLIALACSKPPAGRARWTLQLLEEAVVEPKISERASDNTIGRMLQKTRSSRI